MSATRLALLCAAVSFGLAAEVPARAATPPRVAARPVTTSPEVRPDLVRCVTDRATDPGQERPWRGCPPGFAPPFAAGSAPASGVGEPLPQCAAAPGVNDRCEVWERRLDQATQGIVGLAAAPRAGRVFVAGTGTRPDNGADAIVVGAFDTAGRALWSVRAPTSLPTRATAIASARDGRRVFVTGYVSLRPQLSSPVFDYYYTLALDGASGRILWAQPYPGIRAMVNRPLAIAVSPDARMVVVTGVSEGSCAPGCPAPPADWATVAYSAPTGRALWTGRYSGLRGGQNAAVAVAFAPNGRQVFVTGYSERPTLQPTAIYDAATAAYRTTDGRRVWVRRHAGGPATVPASVLVAPRGDTVYVAATGSDAAPGGSILWKYTVLAYRASTGTPRWTASYRNLPGTSNVLRGAAVSPRGDHVYVTGHGRQRDSALPADAAFAALAQTTVAFSAATGRTAWVASFAPSGQPAAGMAVAVDPGGRRVYVGGVVAAPLPTPAPVGYSATVAYTAASGTAEWVARYDLRDPAVAGFNAPVGLGAPGGDAVYQAVRISPVTVLTGQAVSTGLLLAYQA